MRILKKYNVISIQAKAALWFVICSFLQKGISFITVPVFTRLMSTEQYGTYTLYLSWLQAFTIITSLYLYNGVLDNAMAKFKGDRDRYIASMQGLTIVIWLFVGIIFLFIYPLTRSMFALSPVFFLMMFVEMFFTPATSYWMGRQRFEYTYKRLVFFTLSKSALNPVIGILFVSLSSQKDIARVFSIVIIEVVFGGLIFVYQFYKGRTFFSKKYWSYGIKLAIPMLPHYLSGMILNQGDRIMIDYFVGRSSVALYGLAHSIGMIAQIFIGAVNNAMTPWLYRKIEEKNTKEIRKTTTLLVLFIAGITIILMLISPEMIAFFGSKEYADAVYVVPPIAASTYFVFLYSLLSFPQFYFEKTKFLMIASLGAAGANIILNYLFIRAFGYIAAGYTTLFCYVLYAIGHYFVSRKIMKSEMGTVAFIVDEQLILFTSLVLIVITILVNFIMYQYFLRYAIILLMLFGMWSKRKFFIDKIKEMRSAR